MQEVMIVDDSASEASSVTLGDEPDDEWLHSEYEQESLPTSPDIPDHQPSVEEEGREVIDLTTGEGFCDGDYLTDEAYERLLRNWNKREERSSAAQVPVRTRPEKRRLPEVCMNEIVYREGQSVELHDGTFLRIEVILADRSGDIFFCGRRLLKTTNHKGTYIPRWRNELVWITNEMADIPFDLVKTFVGITFTNHCHLSQDDRKKARPFDLFCRLKEHIGGKNPSSVEYLTPEEADEGFKYDPQMLRYAWRGQTSLFGAFEQTGVVEIDDDETVLAQNDAVRAMKRRRQYTFGDAFCGAGGVSCGARAAGLRPKWACDKSPHAAETYQLNYSNADVWNLDIFDFLEANSDPKVDIIHGSPPCQTFSPAKTIECATDDANSACVFSCSNLIQKAKPRVLTMEETSGLIERHSETSNRVVLDFIELGYGTRWGILNCVNYGVPQMRRRSVIIASGPGETLPPFPKPTHGLPGSGLPLFITIDQTISRIPLEAANHNVDRASAGGIWRAPFDADQQARTITCGGGENNYHPSGERGYTNREYACLQTFPVRYQFGQKEVRKQIGNAVPPKLAEALYKEIIRSLHQTDEKELGRRRGWITDVGR
ncbi:DNA cytosine methyltransferase [Aspergillus homomorphus CBS 101889]|uniref:DNA (cytosine-5-)-methyltransferase n=1 Tax=Aspergillus homomorphus (strain CBS 101889) TaxID=1450537 RepID=A0A395HLQ8_ASPHC|nr:C-5 cytosine methyltransferase DmtA [Aspergillus homomorphus CBS 101889]RAL08363.1 C-5 cytosine methyltransferase DmtA [Aspergillus homomorphus CBS 101889]